MVISSFGGSRIVRVVRIIVVWAVLEVRRIKSFHTQRSAQVLVRKPQRAKSVYWIEQLRCHDHCDREVWPELVVRPLPPGTRAENILIDPSTVNEPCGDLVLGIVGGI